MIAVALTLVRYEIDTRYDKFDYISTDMYSLYVNNTQNYSIFKFSTNTAVCGGSSHLSPPDNAMHVATRLIQLYLMYPRTIASFLRLYLLGVSFTCSGS
jgi:hypothetical protein